MYWERDLNGLRKRVKNWRQCGNPLVVQWLGLRAFTAEDPVLIPGWGTKILQKLATKGDDIGKKWVGVEFCLVFRMQDT